MEFRQIFGSENAAQDDLLEDCYVPPPGVVLGKPILVGKWGTGKTGLLLHRNAALSRALRSKSPYRDRIWYLDETSVQLQTLKHIEQLCSNDIHVTKRLLENLWTSEIVRAAASVLTELYNYYGSPRGWHWAQITQLSQINSRNTVWDLIPSALGIVLSSEKSSSSAELIQKIRSMHDDKILMALQLCLKDISHFDVKPIIAIEPIETPTSAIEKETDLAQLLVTCLLNVFHRHFEPSARQLLKVEISIPWHRYVRDEIGEPQKLSPFIGRFRWTKTSLRAFINRRIEWEFRRVRRNFSEKGNIDAWSTLFSDSVRNSNNGHVEKSFEYVLRHTQYRVRDLLRLSREMIEHEAVHRGCSIDEVLSGQGGRKVAEKNIRAAIVKACKSTAGERIIEGNRRFLGLEENVEMLRAISVPFTLADVKSRNPLDRETSEIFKIMNQFWNAGIVGIQLTATGQRAISQLKSSFDGVNGKSIGNHVTVFYLFEHATDKNLTDILYTFDKKDGHNENGDIFVKLVLHPMLFEHLDARIVENHPVGI